MMSNRLIRKRGTRQRREAAEIEMTSLLDIIVTLLIFLVTSYNSTGVVFNITPEIKLPKSESIDLNNTGVNVQVSQNSIWVDEVVVFNFSTKNSANLYEQDGQRIMPLFDELIRKKQLVKQVQQLSPGTQKFSGIVNLIIDKKIKYSLMKKILATCAEAGFAQYKFVVMGEEN